MWNCLLFYGVLLLYSFGQDIFSATTRYPMTGGYINVRYRYKIDVIRENWLLFGKQHELWNSWKLYELPTIKYFSRNSNCKRFTRITYLLLTNSNIKHFSLDKPRNIKLNLHWTNNFPDNPSCCFPITRNNNSSK